MAGGGGIVSAGLGSFGGRGRQRVLPYRRAEGGWVLEGGRKGRAHAEAGLLAMGVLPLDARPQCSGASYLRKPEFLLPHPLYSAPLKVEKVVRVVLDGTHLIITCSFKQPTNIY